MNFWEKLGLLMVVAGISHPEWLASKFDLTLLLIGGLVFFFFGKGILEDGNEP